MLVGICGQKGGTGKTTLATNLAVYFAEEGYRVILVDTDPQGSAYGWYQRRLTVESEVVPVHTIQASGDVFDLLVEQSRNYDLVMVDCGGMDSDALRTTVAVSHLVYVPLQPSQLDIDTTARMDLLIREASLINRNLQATAILTRASTNIHNRERHEAKEALGMLSSMGISRVTVFDRKIYRDAILEGLGVTEMDNPKAKAEIQLLGQEILDQANTLAQRRAGAEA